MNKRAGKVGVERKFKRDVVDESETSGERRLRLEDEQVYEERRNLIERERELPIKPTQREGDDFAQRYEEGEKNEGREIPARDSAEEVESKEGEGSEIGDTEMGDN